MSLDGEWINELNSSVVLRTFPDGLLEGEYKTAVSKNNGALPPIKVIGNWQNGGARILFGFVAQWHYEKDGKEFFSTTSWSGFMENNKLETTWLLTNAEEPSWSATRINKDFFTRV